MNKNLIAAFGLGVLIAGLVGYVVSKPSAAVPTKELVVAQVTEPPKETLPAAGSQPGDPAAAPAPGAEAPKIETPPHSTRVTPPEKPAPRPARPTTVADARKASTPADPVRRGEAAPVAASPAPASTPAPVPVSTPATAPPESRPAPEILRPDPSAPAPAAKKREPQTVSIKEGTVVAIRTSEMLSSEKHQAGDTFTAALAEPIIVDGFVLAERGSRVTGRVVESVPAGKVKGVARLSLELTQVSLTDGQKLQLATDPFLREGATSRKSDAAKVGAGAAIGAALGGIFGGGKGAAIGGAAGAGAGGGAVILTRGKPVEIESESRLPFRISRTFDGGGKALTRS